jgi:hypothetical protein
MFNFQSSRLRLVTRNQALTAPYVVNQSDYTTNPNGSLSYRDPLTSITTCIGRCTPEYIAYCQTYSIKVFCPLASIAPLSTCTATDLTYSYTLTTGQKQYELSNHLGNVLTTLSDRKIGNSIAGSQNISYFSPVILSADDY